MSDSIVVLLPQEWEQRARPGEVQVLSEASKTRNGFVGDEVELYEGEFAGSGTLTLENTLLQAQPAREGSS